MSELIVTGLFWLQWMLVTSLCLTLVLPMWKSIGPWSLVAYWFVLGFSQSLVLVQRIPWALTSWFLATSLAGVYWLILLILMFCLFFFVGLHIVDPSPFFGGAELEALGFVLIITLPISLFIVAGGGALLGWAQWRVLRHHVTHLSWWVSASIVSWILGSIVSLIFLFSFKTELFRLDMNSALTMADSAFSKMLLSLTGVGAIGGVIKGGILAWSLHQSRRY